MYVLLLLYWVRTRPSTPKKLRVVVEQQTTPKVSVKHNNIGSSPVASGYVVDQTQFCVKIREQYFIQDGEHEYQTQ